MSVLFYFVIGIILAVIGLLLILAKVMSYIRCTVLINASVVNLEEENIYYRSVNYTYYYPVVEYIVDGKCYSQKAYFRTSRKTKYPINSKMDIYYNPKNPDEIRFIGHPFPLPMGLILLSIGAVLIYFYFL